MNIKKRQEIINLMPWYNLGKLSDTEKAMVDAALSEDPSLKEQLSLDQDIMSKVLADPKLLDRSAFASSSIRLDKVLAQIDDAVVTNLAEKKQATAKEKRQPIVNPFAGIKSFFTNLISGSSHSFTYAVFAALTVVQLSLLLFFIVPSAIQQEPERIAQKESERSDFSPAGEDRGLPNIVKAPIGAPSADKADSGMVLRITIADNAQHEGFTFASKEFGDIKVYLLPSQDGYYRIRLDKKLSSAEFKVLKNELLRNTANIVSIDKEDQSQ